MSWFSLRPFLPAAGLAVLGLLWVCGLTVWPRDGQPVAAFFWPLGSDAATLGATSQAGAEAVLAFGNWPGVVLAHSSNPDFVARLYQGGAMLVLRAPANSGCMSN